MLSKLDESPLTFNLKRIYTNCQLNIVTKDMASVFGSHLSSQVDGVVKCSLQWP